MREAVVAAVMLLSSSGMAWADSTGVDPRTSHSAAPSAAEHAYAAPTAGQPIPQAVTPRIRHVTHPPLQTRARPMPTLRGPPRDRERQALQVAQVRSAWCKESRLDRTQR
jgi:hypothetical protein